MANVCVYPRAHSETGHSGDHCHPPPVFGSLPPQGQRCCSRCCIVSNEDRLGTIFELSEGATIGKAMIGRATIGRARSYAMDME